MRRRRFLLALLPLAAVLLGGWAFWYEPSSLVLRHETLALPGWPEAQDGLTLALLSDLHVGAPYYGLEMVEAVVARVNEAEPDVVLLAGDYVIHGVPGGTFVRPEDTASVLGRLRAPLGVYAVLGNHEFWLDAERVQEAFEKEGLAVLRDEARRLSNARFDFWLLGWEDWWEGGPDIEGSVATVPDGLPLVAFTHNPDLFPGVPSRVTLTLAGHTHGGQVRLPFFGTPIVPSQFGSRYARGLVVEDGRHLFVTSGLGTSVMPVRFRVPPEIVLLRLVAAGGKEAS